MSRISQVYFTDYMVATFIFALFVMMYYLYAPNITDSQKEDYDLLLVEAKSISNSLLSEGIPKDWTEANVVRIGLADSDKKLDISKTGRFYNMSYNTTTARFNIIHQHYVYVKDLDGNAIFFEGKNATGYYDPETALRVTKVSRIVPYDDELMEMVILIWE